MTVNRRRTESPVRGQSKSPPPGLCLTDKPLISHTPRPPARGRADSFALRPRFVRTSRTHPDYEGASYPFVKNLLKRRGAPGRTRPACAQAVPIRSHSGPSSPLGPETRPERLHLPLRSAQIPSASANGRYLQAKSHLIGTNESVDKARRNRYAVCE